MMLFDCHIHLQDDRIYPDLDRLLIEADLSGVKGWICCGSAQSDWELVRDIASKNKAIIPSYGIHPWYINSITSNWIQELRCFLDDGNAGIGEIGLDFAVTNRNDKLQEDLFRAQLELAAEKNLPVSVHCRKAWDVMIRVLGEYKMKQINIILHSYSGPLELIPRLIELNCWFSFSGSITRSNNRRGHDAVRAVPEGRLLIETDAPDLPPVIDHRVTEPNMPANLVYTLDKVAELRGWTKENTAASIWRNAHNVLSGIMGDR